jgi:predicted transcriptional regulator of viral defense system
MTKKPDYDRLYEFAEDQAGYFTAAQARQAGFSWERLSNSVKSGKFQRVSTGVYRLTQFPRHPNEDLFYIWLATGPDSAISNESALAYYELSDALPTEIHVIVPRTASRRRNNIRLHTNRLAPDEILMRGGLRITTVSRTIADIAASGLAEEQVRQAIREALRRGLVTRNDLIDQADRRGGRAKRIILEALKQGGEE